MRVFTGGFLPTKAIKIMLHRLHDILDNVDCIHPLFTADVTNVNAAH